MSGLAHLLTTRPSVLSWTWMNRSNWRNLLVIDMMDGEGVDLDSYAIFDSFEICFNLLIERRFNERYRYRLIREGRSSHSRYCSEVGVVWPGYGIELSSCEGVIVDYGLVNTYLRYSSRRPRILRGSMVKLVDVFDVWFRVIASESWPCLGRCISIGRCIHNSVAGEASEDVFIRLAQLISVQVCVS